MKESLIKEKSYEFALQIISLYRKLCKTNEYVLSKQLLRSGTSIGANAHPVKSKEVTFNRARKRQERRIIG